MKGQNFLIQVNKGQKDNIININISPYEIMNNIVSKMSFPLEMREFHPVIFQ